MTSELSEEHERCQGQLRALTDQNQVFQKKHDGLSRLSVGGPLVARPADPQALRLS